MARARGREFVGANLHDDVGFDGGAAYVFRRAGPPVAEVQEILRSDNRGRFGTPVATAEEGATLVVRAITNSPGGSLYVLERQGNGSYLETNELKGPNPSLGDAFGSSAALSDDGLTLVVGDTEDNNFVAANHGPGSAHVFRRV